MNSFISNFKNKKTLVFLAAVLLLQILIEFILVQYVSRKTSQKTFVEDKNSKKIHLQLQGDKTFDYIFVGSSKTIFHISTEYFKEKKLHTYNFGISGVDLSDFPSIIDVALRQKPKAIVLSLTLDQLSKDDKFNYKNSNWQDLGFFIKSEQPISEILRMAKSCIKNSFSLLRYSEIIYIRIRDLLNSISEKMASDHLISKQNPEVNLISEIGNASNHSIYGCNIFSIEKPSNLKTIYKCSNGDGSIWGTLPIPIQRKESPELDISNENVSLLNSLIEKITQNGVAVFIVFEPMLTVKTSDTAPILKLIENKAQVINLSNFYLPPNYIADSAHFNERGRLEYSSALFNKLSEISKAGP